MELQLQLQALTPSLAQLRLESPNPNTNSNLGPLQCTSFKRTKTKAEREERRAQRKKKKQDKKEKVRKLLLVPQLQVSNPSERLNPAIQWPIEPPPPRAGWGDPKPARYRTTTAEEKVKIAGVRLQRNASKSCRDFFSRKEASDDDLMEEEEDDDDGDEENEIFRFFLGLFSGDGDLKRCYEKGEEFLCLLCEGKRFGDCVALIQHSAAISKTKRRAGHRAFGRALCWVLGLDVGRFGFIVSDNSVVQSMIKTKLKEQGGLKEDNDVGQKNADSVTLETECSVMTTLH